MPRAGFSVERLVHFQCGVCRGWWSIGDAPDREHWFCPWCGICLEGTLPLAAPSAAPAPSEPPSA